MIQVEAVAPPDVALIDRQQRIRRQIRLAYCGDHSPDVAMLLPDRDYNAQLLDQVTMSTSPAPAWVGLFCADPFLHHSLACKSLADTGVEGLCNFPSVGFYGADFHRQLADVGFSLAGEMGYLGKAQSEGFRIIACLPGDIDGTTVNPTIGELKPDAWIIHGGLSAIQHRAGTSPASPDWMNQLEGERYLYQPGVELVDLPGEYSGLVSASWWK